MCIYMCLYVDPCIWMQVPTEARGRGVGAPWLQVGVNPLTWMLGTEPVSSGRAACTLGSLALFSAPLH